jgi:hypothetical protein
MIPQAHKEIFDRAITVAVFGMRKKFSVNDKYYVSEHFCREVIQMARELVEVYDENGLSNSPGNTF